MATLTTTARLLALLAVGICEALKEERIEIREAERLLFSPHVMSKAASIDPRIAELIHMGTELDDIKDLVPEDYEPTIQRIRDAALNLLQTASEESEHEQEHWVDSIVSE